MDQLSDLDDKDHGEARRTFLKKAAYVTPAIFTLKAVPSFASYGSGPAPAPTGPADDGVGGGFNPHPPKGSKDKPPKDKEPKAPKDKAEKQGKPKKNK